MMQKILPVAVITVAMLAAALVAVWTQEAILVPSLGSAVFIQALSPGQPGAKPYSVGMGQVLGLVAALIALSVTASAHLPMFTTGHVLVYGRVLALLVAVPLTTGLQLALGATSPAGGATVLVTTLGLETPDLAGVARMLVGIVLVTAIGEVGRQLILRQQEKSP